MMKKIFFTMLIMTVLISTFSVGASPLDGIWLQDCHVKNNTDILTSKLVVDDKSWKHSFVAHEDSECNIGYMIFTVYGEVQGQVETENDQGSFDVTVSKVSYILLDEAVADSFSLSGFCGINDWKAGEETFVEGKDCGDYKAPVAGAKIYSKFAFYGTDQLYLGITKAGYIENTPELRYEELDVNSFNRYIDMN